MKKTMTYKSRLVRWGMTALLPVLAAGCLMEEPELTADGNVGEDPTSVTVEATLSFDRNLPDADSGKDSLYVTAEEYPNARCRVTMAAYEGTSFAGRTVVYEDIPLTSRFQTRVSLPLHARNYRLAVWVDYYGDFDTDEVAETDSCYNTFDFTSIIRPGSRYIGGRMSETRGMEHEDAFYACQEIDLRPYRDDWEAKVPVSMELTRPLGRFELRAIDLADFLEKEEVAGLNDDDALQMSLEFDAGLPVGYDVLSDVTRHAFQGMSISRSLNKGRLADFVANNPGQDYVLVSDYFLIDKDETTSIPVTLRIYRPTNEDVEYARYSFRLQCRRGVSKVISAPFLTTDPDGGIGFDTEFDDEINVDLDD